MHKKKDPLGKYFKQGPVLRMEIKGVFFARSGKVHNQIFNYFVS